MPTHHIVLSEEDIERIINGEEVSFDFNRQINPGEKIIVRQSYIKDMAAPIINRDKKVYSNAEIENIKRASSMMADTLKLGY